jgi:hypothetical protein
MVYPTNALTTDQMKVIQGLGFVKTKGGLYEMPANAACWWAQGT